MTLVASIRSLVARYPLQMFFTVATVAAILLTAAFYAGLLPITRSIRNLIRFVSLSLVLFLFAAAFWAPPLFERLLGD
jgi:hypothetical protein